MGKLFIFVSRNKGLAQRKKKNDKNMKKHLETAYLCFKFSSFPFAISGSPAFNYSRSFSLIREREIKICLRIQDFSMVVDEEHEPFYEQVAL